MSEESGDDEGGSGLVMAMVTCDFEAEDEVELPLKCGEIVQVLNQDVGDGWWSGSLEIGGKQGLFPSDYVELLLPDSDDDSDSEKTDVDALPPPPSPLASPGSVRASHLPSPPPSPPGSPAASAARPRGPAPPPPPRPPTVLLSATSPPSPTISPLSGRKRVSTLPPQEGSLDPVTARKLLATGQAPCIVAGPRWFSETCPPVVRITDTRRESKLSGVKQFITYVVESYQQAETVVPHAVVSRRYKHFLWLHESLTELFPGIVVPPLPVKQYAGRFEDSFVQQRQLQLERFLNRVARNPLMRVSHVFTHFLTATSFENWKHGKNSVRRSIMYSKPSKRLESPQFYYALSFPQNNIPYDRVVLVENFSTFTKLLRRNTAALQTTASTQTTAYGELSSSYAKLGSAMQCLAAGRTPAPERRSTTTDVRRLSRLDGDAKKASSPSAVKKPSSPPAIKKQKKSKFYSSSDDNKKQNGSTVASPPAARASPTALPPTPTESSKFYQPIAEDETPDAAEKKRQSRPRVGPPPPLPPSAQRPVPKPRGVSVVMTGQGNGSGGGGVDRRAEQPQGIEYVPSQEVKNWAWKTTCPRFPRLMGRLHGVGSGLVQLSQAVLNADSSASPDATATSPSTAGPAGAAGKAASSSSSPATSSPVASLEAELKEYVGLLQAVPNIVRCHEDAIEQLNAAKSSAVQRDILSQATRHADTCSNVVLAEMDHFYESLLTDLEHMVATHLREKVNMHTQMAENYQKMLNMFERED